MIVAFALRSAWKKLRVFTSVLVLAFLLFYLLPKIFCLLWHGNQFEEQIRDDPLPGKPLRVFQPYNTESVSLASHTKRSSLDEENRQKGGMNGRLR